jgi:hypothetical protein
MRGIPIETLDFSSVEKLLASARAFTKHSPYGGKGYVLVDSREVDTRGRFEDTITMDPLFDTVSDYTRFFQVNNSLLKDARLLPKRSTPPSVPANPALANSDVIAITGAHTPNGVEIVTFFDLRDSSTTATLHGKMVVIQSKKSAEGIDSVDSLLSSSPRRRVYYYGDELQNINLRKLVEASGNEFIRRSPELSHDLLGTNMRLQELESRPFVEDKLSIINGLPDSPDSVALMGPLAGDPADWLDFRNRVVETLSGRKAQMVTSREDFVNELTQGENDVIVLVAHSTGTYLYLNGERLSIEDLKALPPRRTPSRRPRLAVLVSCEAGKPASQEPGWRNWFKKSGTARADLGGKGVRRQSDCA